MNATRQKIVFQNGLAQEIVALLRTLTTETLSGAHLVGSLMHSLYNSRA